jgi:serpin B
MALAMTPGGARGETAAEMARVLHLALGDTAHAEAGELLETWNDPAEHDYELRVVSRLFAAESLALAPAFVELTSARYAAPVEALDFASAPEPSRARINDYIEEQTRQRIKDLLPPGSVDRTTRLVLTNAVYLLAKWQSPFEANSTRPASFHTGGRALAVPTMHQTGHFAFAEVSGVKALELRYRGGDFAMVFLLPATNDGLPALERELDPERLGAILEALETQRVRVALPKVKLDPPAPLALGAILAGMGMPLAFSGDADFGGMVADPSRERLAISEVFHKAFVLIDEEGTEAAAATAVVMVRSAAMPQADAATFIADHPYLFLLRDLRSGALLFVGRVVDPS